MPPKKYNDFIEGDPITRLSKHHPTSPTDKRIYVPIQCPHCMTDFVEVPSERLATNKASACRNHLAECTTDGAENDPRRPSDAPQPSAKRTRTVTEDRPSESPDASTTLVVQENGASRASTSFPLTNEQLLQNHYQLQLLTADHLRLNGKVMRLHMEMVTVSKFLSPIPRDVLQWSSVTCDNAIEKGREFFSPLLTITDTEPCMAFDVPNLTMTSSIEPKALLAATTPGPSDIRDAEIAQLAQELRHERARISVLERENGAQRTTIENLTNEKELKSVKHLNKSLRKKADDVLMDLCNTSKVFDKLVSGCEVLMNTEALPLPTREGIRVALANSAVCVFKTTSYSMLHLPNLGRHLP